MLRYVRRLDVMTITTHVMVVIENFKMAAIIFLTLVRASVAAAQYVGGLKFENLNY